MSVANIYQKMMELENKMKTLSPNTIQNNSSDIHKDLLDRISALENKSSTVVPPSQDFMDRIQVIETKVNQLDLKESSPSNNNIQELVDRMQILENKQMPPDLSDRVLMIESKQVPNEIPSDLLDRLNKLELRFIPPDLTDRVLNIETDKYISQLPSVYDRIDTLEKSLNELKEAYFEIVTKINNLLTPPSQQLETVNE